MYKDEKKRDENNKENEKIEDKFFFWVNKIEDR